VESNGAVMPPERVDVRGGPPRFSNRAAPAGMLFVLRRTHSGGYIQVTDPALSPPRQAMQRRAACLDVDPLVGNTVAARKSRMLQATADAPMPDQDDLRSHRPRVTVDHDMAL